MKILAIETATEACSVALNRDGEILEKYSISPRQQSRLILPMIDSILAEAEVTLSQLDALSFGCGPGSFTGVRIAAGVIQGIAFGVDLPVVPVSTLAAMAQDVFCSGNQSAAFTAIDARMGEVYWGVYVKSKDGYANLWEKETVRHCSQVTYPEGLVGMGVGSGWRAYREELKSRLKSRISGVDAELLPRARAVARLGVKGFLESRTVSAEKALPVYLRNQVAREKNDSN